MPLGLDIGTGFVKIAYGANRTARFPSIISRGRDIDLDGFASGNGGGGGGGGGANVIHIGYDAAKYERIRSMTIHTPVYRGAPTNMGDYVAIVRHALDTVISGGNSAKGAADGSSSSSSSGSSGNTRNNDNSRNSSNRYGSMIIVGGIPYSARNEAQKIKNEITKALKPKFFGLIYQARATLIHEGVEDGIVCHIGHGTTELMALVHGRTAQAKTIRRGVGDIVSEMTDSKVQYINSEIFTQDTPDLTEQRMRLAGQISDVLEKMVVDFADLPVICAGGGVMIPKLIQEIRNDIITDVRIAQDPVFSNALGMLRKAEGRQNGPYGKR